MCCIGGAGESSMAAPDSTYYYYKNSIQSIAANDDALPTAHRKLMRSPKQTADISMDRIRVEPCIRGYSCADGRLTQTGEYGIPYECMLPKEIDNLLVACRGSSFTHLAASSARLSRTMLQLGEAACYAAVVCIRENLLPSTIPIEAIQR